MNCAQTFECIYKNFPQDITFCPYRICPLGAHIDHQLGKINGLAIDKGVYFAYKTKHSGICELHSVNFPGKRAQFHVDAIPETRQGDWADHLRGAALKLGEQRKLRFGVAGVFEGDLPIGGLSSSTAVIIVFLSALCRVNDINLTARELILMAQAAENEYVGVNCGKLDQSCEVLCRKDHLLYLDTMDDSYELIDTPKNMPPYQIAIFFSGLERSLANSQYNARQDECKAAAYALKALSGMPYGRFKDSRLRDVPPAVYHQYGEQLPKAWKRRAEHFYSELARVEAGTEAWRKGNLKEYGRLVFESGYSSIYNYESGSEELRTIYEIMRHTEGIYGGRFSGAGFKGCCMALIDPAFAEEIERRVTQEYLRAFPKLEGKYSFHLCESADGMTV